MARVRTVDFLPEIFQTSTNRQFLSATLDQLVQEPKFKKTQGFVGRHIGPGVNPQDKYVVEPTLSRTNYQLEPGVIVNDANTKTPNDAITFPGIIDALQLQGADVTKPSRLFSSDYYTWDPFVDLDKFVNFSQYYWLPLGPDPVDVNSGQLPVTDDFAVTTSTTPVGYEFSGLAGTNPVINLVRGGNYTFEINQPGHQFWIQSAPGVDGRNPISPNMTSRSVLGVINNGTEGGTVTFNVPKKTAQNFYYNLTEIASVDLLSTTLKPADIDGVLVTNFLKKYPTGIDGISDLDGRTIVFTSKTESGWKITTLFDPVTPGPENVGQPGAYDTYSFDQDTEITSINERYSVWQIKFVQISDNQYIMQLVNVRPVNNVEKFQILFGTEWASTYWYKYDEFFNEVPSLTAVLDTLYYQDSTNPALSGQIRLQEATSESNSYLFIEDIIGKKTFTSPNGVVFSNGLKVQFQGQVLPAEFANRTYYVEGVGTAIQLLPTEEFVTPEPFTTSRSIPYDSTLFDSDNFDANLNAPSKQDYITINRASQDLNAWTRSNRWFHVDVLRATSVYNNQTIDIDNISRGKRPILEFRAGIKLNQFGTKGKQPIDIIDFTQTDALSNINGTTGYYINAYPLITGTRVIFAADTDDQVRNKVYEVEFIIPDSIPPLIAQPVINLVPAYDSVPLINETVVCLNGVTLQGKSFYYDGITWQTAQDKTGINQGPLFDIYDLNGISLGNKEIYPSSTFVGNKLFSYAQGTGIKDSELGFPLKYLSLNNVGDIVFDNNFYNDSFVYVKDGVSYTEDMSIGFVRSYSDRTVYQSLIGWQNAEMKSQEYQQFTFNWDGTVLKLDIPVILNAPYPGVKIYADSKFIDPTQYVVTVTDLGTEILMLDEFVIGTIIEVLALSPQASRVGFYQVPLNLECNPLNQNSTSFTLGTVRNHYQSVAENLKGITGKINGANNSRDLGNIIPYGLILLQQSSPLTLTGYFLRKQEYQLFSAIEYNNREYTKFKSRLLEKVVNTDWGTMTVPEIITAAVIDLSGGRTSLSPFYWSDMIPCGSVYTENTFTFTAISTYIFDTVQTYDFNSSNYLGLLVYLNGEILKINYDYIVSDGAPSITIIRTLTPGDKITIQEFPATYGSFVPNTPTKMGLYPSYKPEVYVDYTYVEARTVIRGHDGSLTVAFNDVRDQVLLEFENRIFNNLKIKSRIPLEAVDVIPGQFRKTDYSISEIQDILGRDFLSWVGWNKLDYRSQTYIPGNEFTYNYSSSGNKIDQQPLLGAWRGIYRYFYDTENPNSRPWELLGFAEEPSWWATVYGSAPYTGDNLVLWDDLEAGYVADPAGAYIKPAYVRPGLSQVIPSSDQGDLLSPFDAVVGSYDPIQFKKSWTVGDGGPVEASWYASSSYPFAVMRLLALTRPAEFFNLFVDRDLYKYNSDMDQYLYNERYRFDPNKLEVYGNGTSKASYINWIVDYNRQLGKNSTDDLTTDLDNIDVRLCYRMAAFSDKQYLKIYSEKSSPNSLNNSLLLPDESYSILLYKNQPFENITYSSVIIQRTNTGWTVNGYSTLNQYFNILVSQPSGLTATVSAGGLSVQVPAQYTSNVVQVPYGYEFTNQSIVCDFLMSYGQLLKQQGIEFDAVENGYVLNWQQMAAEFLYWSQQGWAVGSIINLNPVASVFRVTKPLAVADAIVELTPETIIQDQNRLRLPVRDLIIERIENTITITSPTQRTISYLSLNFVNYEHMIVLDNISTFADLIYQPITNARQNRLNVVGYTTTEWNGTVDPQGFVLNEDNIKEWQANVRYTKGQIVSYKNNLWSARTIVQPKAEFAYDDWLKSDYTRIQTGLLPNIPNKANQLTNSYNTNNANLESDNDLLSYGLIGFRPREYMQALNLDDTSQVNLYSQFLGTKGTVRSAELFTFANLGKEAAQYIIYENWAIQRGIYGANSNKSYFELRLDQALLTGNPSIIEVVLPQQRSDADQTVLLDDVWKESYKLPSIDILPTHYLTLNDSTLPNAGFVDIDDVDITVFDINDPTSLDANLDEIGVGTKIWIAKINNHDWGVFRTTLVPGNIVLMNDNLDGTTLAQFTTPHGLSVNETIIIKYFNDNANGVYKVLGIPTIDSIVIAYSAPDPIVAITGIGVVFKLGTMRVAEASAVVNLPYSTDLLPGAFVWVDNIGDGRWAVLQKQQPFSAVIDIAPGDAVANSNFGYSVAQSKDNTGALVGAPDFDAAGAVYAYNRGLDVLYAVNEIVQLNSVGTADYGSSVALSSVNWGAIGAPSSLSDVGYVSIVYKEPSTGGTGITQLLIGSDQPGPGRFGENVSLSQDGRWLYASAPAVNQVYAFGRVDIEEQQITYIATGLTNRFSTTGIQYDNTAQIAVLLNNKELVINEDYNITSTEVLLFETPVTGNVLKIVRRTAIQLDHGVYYNVEQYSTTGTGTGAKFTVERSCGKYTASITNNGQGYTVGDQIVLLATDVGGGTVPINNVILTVINVGGSTGVYYIQTSGHAAQASTFQLRDTLYSAENIWSFSVYVDGILQRPKIDYEYAGADPDSSLTPYELVFPTLPAWGATIFAVAGTYYQEVAILTVDGLSAGAKLGYGLHTSTDGRQVLLGAPNDTVNSVTNAGAVYSFDRSVENFTVTSTQTKSFTVQGTLVEPVSVLLNNVFLTNETNYYNGQFTVSGNTVTLLSTVALNIGDVVTVESNQFRQLQKVTSPVPSQDAYFGSAVDLCVNNCSSYTGSPNDNTVLPGAGSVDRHVNQARIYGTISTTIASATTFTVGSSIRINNVPVTLTSTTITSLIADINNTAIPNVVATVVTTPGATVSTITISAKNIAATTPLSRLQLSPGLGNAWTLLEFPVYAFTQTITSPNPVNFANFGSSLSIDSSASILVVGAPRGNTVLPVTFDAGTTTFDARSTNFNSTYIESGAVYEFDYLPSASDTIYNPGKFVFGQQIVDGTNIESYDKFGTAVSYVSGVLMVGSPGDDLGDSVLSNVNYGRVGLFSNPDLKPAWSISHIQQPVVDVALLNSVFIYDISMQEAQTYFDFFDPLQGKIIGPAQRNIDFITGIDPALYNVGNIDSKNTWTATQVGKVWWDTSTVRFIDPNQDDIVYASKKWGNVFPGSTISVYQWIENSVPPAQYAGEGTPYSLTNYSVNTALSTDGTFRTLYYYWVKNILAVDTTAGKTLSVNTVARYIENPRSSGVPYIAALNSSTIAMYNATNYINATSSILHVEFDRQLTDANVHFEYELIAQDKDTSFISAGLFRKLQDSFCGTDTLGNLVPDPTLSPGEQIGVLVRPRQSMFVNRFLALQNYLQRANRILALYPITETRKFNLLNSAEPTPNSVSGEWNKVVANLEELSYQDLAIVPTGYRYLVLSDSSQAGLWTIYQVMSDVTLQLYRVQGYDTPRYWSYINWYKVGYNSSTNVVTKVPNYSSLATLSVPIGSSVEVTANAQDKFEIYLLTDLGWERVGLENGTIEFSASLWNYQIGRFGFDVEVFDAQYFDQAPIEETRRIIQAINDELFIDDLLIERNRSLVLMFNYILSETQSPEWLTKTSLIDVEHKIRDLIPYQIYRQDNQDFVLQYIQEVKPYHSQVKQFNLTYDGNDIYLGTLADFDLPAFYDTALPVPQFVSPILDNTGTMSANSSVPSTSSLWQTFPYNQWFNNYQLQVLSVTLVTGGTGYSSPPQVIITGDCTTPAVVIAVINSAGSVVAFNIQDSGSGYTATPTIELVGGAGTGATAVAVMYNNLVRTICINVKFDRYQYNTTVTPWESGVMYDNGTLVRYIDRVWQANSADSAVEPSTTFDPDNWLVVPASELSGVDRTMGFYVSQVNTPGLELPLLINGVEYPGVQVTAPGFSENTGFDIGNFDINPFDNISYSPEGFPTYSESILDAEYRSSFSDIYLGTRITDINVDGGEFVGPYESYAPEELVPGIEFDTVNIRVNTRPGADWTGNGHGWPQDSKFFTFSSATPTLSFADTSVKYPVTIVVTNTTQELYLNPVVNYTVDYVNQTVTILSGVNNNEILVINVFGLGGGSQLYRTAKNGGEIGLTTSIPVNYSEIDELAIFVNGNQFTDFTYEAVPLIHETKINFGIILTSFDEVTIVALGVTDDSFQRSWSTPVVQYITITDPTQLTYTLTNNLEYTNPDNLIVTNNGFRARPAQGAEYIADGSSADFLLPQRGGYSQGLIADNDVRVYLNDQPQTLGTDFTVSAWDGISPRSVILANTPDSGIRVLIAVSTQAQYVINLDASSNEITFRVDSQFGLQVGDVIAITTWNDTSEQNLLTLVYVGPLSTGSAAYEGYDDTVFDEANYPGPGTFDYGVGTIVYYNDFQLGRNILNPSRLWVTLNGYSLFPGEDYSIVDQELVLVTGAIGQFDVLVVTECTDSVVPDELSFSIFQDMRGVQATYRITDNSSTELTATLGDYDDVIYVKDVTALPVPNLSLNLWGIVMINAERIMYRYIDYANNTVSGLLRGTAGTAKTGHFPGAVVYDLTENNLLMPEYQDHYVTYNQISNGQTQTIVSDITVETIDDSSIIDDEAVQVYVGGILTTDYVMTSNDPVTVFFDPAPPAGYEITIQVKRGQSWYQPGDNTPSNGVALQETNTLAARFLRGL